MKTLIVGCSFVHNLKFHLKINLGRYELFGSSGASNQSIAARVAHQLLTNQYERVVVLWSGINRLSVCFPTSAVDILEYDFVDQIGSSTWYHSGGIGCSGEASGSPALLRNYFRTQYMTADSAYLTDITLKKVIEVQALIKQFQVPSAMSFIYDIHSSAPSQHEVSHGKINQHSPFFDQVDWSVFTAAQPPWEWAAQRNGLFEIDQYHPKPEYLCRWFYEQLSIDLEA